MSSVPALYFTYPCALVEHDGGQPSGDGQQGDVSRQYPVLQFPFLLFHIWFACRGEKIPAVVRWRAAGRVSCRAGLASVCAVARLQMSSSSTAGGKVAYQRHAPVMYGVEHAPRDVRHALHPEPRPERVLAAEADKASGVASRRRGRGRRARAMRRSSRGCELPAHRGRGLRLPHGVYLVRFFGQAAADFGQVAHLAAVRAVEGGGTACVRRHRACHVALLLRVQPVRAQEGVKLPAVHVQVDVDLRGRAVLVPEERDSVVTVSSRLTRFPFPCTSPCLMSPAPWPPPRWAGARSSGARRRPALRGPASQRSTRTVASASPRLRPA